MPRKTAGFVRTFVIAIIVLVLVFLGVLYAAKLRNHQVGRDKLVTDTSRQETAKNQEKTEAEKRQNSEEEQRQEAAGSNSSPVATGDAVALPETGMRETSSVVILAVLAFAATAYLRSRSEARVRL